MSLRLSDRNNGLYGHPTQCWENLVQNMSQELALKGLWRNV